MIPIPFWRNFLMKPLYRHYKNKLYKYLGVARHSETLEELALYEALYENKQGQIWVRPKEMFFEKVVIENQEQDRFAPQEIIVTPLKINLELLNSSNPLLNQTLNLYAALYGSQHAVRLSERLLSKKNAYIHVVELNQKVIGFRIGYESQNKCYYLWMEGIHPQFRNLEMAPFVLKQVMEWAHLLGFKKVRAISSSRQNHRIINFLEEGFYIKGSFSESNNKTRLLLEKHLRS
jgi:hypothetical protein